MIALQFKSFNNKSNLGQWLKLIKLKQQQLMLRNIISNRSPFYFFSRKGFEAIRNTNVQSQVLEGKNQKLDALIDVVLSLNQNQLTYLNELQTRKSLSARESILTNKLYSLNGEKHTPLQFAYQNQWMKKNWKQSHLLTSILVSEEQQDSGKDEQQVVKEIWEIELTSVDPSQKIKIIKVLREMFGLGLKEAKEIADKTPSLIKRERKDEAEKIKELLEKQGCVITVK